MPTVATALLWGLLASSVVAAVAFRRGSLSGSGALAAVVVGTIVFGLGGPAWGALLVLFFVSSSALSHLGSACKQAAAERAEKGHRRDTGQVLANGGLAAALAAAAALAVALGAPPATWWCAFVGAIATVTADTWATEIGTLAPGRPRSVRTGRRVAPGTSGGVSALGIAAAAAGGGTIGAAAALLDPQFDLAAGALFGSLVGLAGSLVDSLLGATVQAQYVCGRCGTETEAPVHRCGTPTRLVRGLTSLDNDRVNFLASLAGAAVGAAAAPLL